MDITITFTVQLWHRLFIPFHSRFHITSERTIFVMNEGISILGVSPISGLIHQFGGFLISGLLLYLHLKILFEIIFMRLLYDYNVSIKYGPI